MGGKGREREGEERGGEVAPPPFLKFLDPPLKLNGGLSWLHSADEDAVSWLTRLVNYD